MSKISRFTSNVGQLAKNAVGERGEVAASEGGGGFAEYAVVSLHCLWVYLERTNISRYSVPATPVFYLSGQCV